VLRADDPLTTKEGWRRFTEHHPQAPDLLSDAALGGLTTGQRADYDDAQGLPR
jgi:hypothetical protein